MNELLNGRIQTLLIFLLRQQFSLLEPHLRLTLKSSWGVHVVQEVKLLAKKEDRKGLDSAIDSSFILVCNGKKFLDIVAYIFSL
ncbi:unnamed protein product [Thlaspi arvense]|uniref:Uncharacterized protein n=1 Tax=Thlaspi arvense TaxID=13288 RepID=A0AAU9S6H5_THLAR|nr:unnamed protein product [Thlaspi arvense]